MAWKESGETNHHNFIGFLVHTIIRFLQFVLAITVCGLYGTDLNAAHKAHVYADSHWVFAVVVGALSAVTALVFMVPFVKTYLAFGWDVILL